jgi:hypothetical protein
MTAADPLAPFHVSRLADATWRVLTVGFLEVRHGGIAAGDPVAGGVGAFTRPVPAGRYRVDLAIAQRGGGGECVGAARVTLRAGSPARWELAVRDGQRVETLHRGQAFGFGVDSGTACFAGSPEAPARAGNALAARLRAREREAIAHATWPLPQRATVVAFAAGTGPGIYASYWGLAADGTPLCLLTDFGVAELAWPEPADHAAERVRYVVSMIERLRATPGAAGDALARALGTHGAEARHLAAELLGMLREPSRQEAWSGIEQCLGEIAREAPEVADLAAELWTPGDPRGRAYLAIVRRARRLAPAAKRALSAAASDRAGDPGERVEDLARVVPELAADEAHALLDGLAHDPAAAVRAAAFAMLRPLEPEELWEHRVERGVGDASPVVRRRVARELGGEPDAPERWRRVLLPMLADVELAVQLEAAAVLANSPRGGSLALEALVRVLRAPPARDEAGEELHGQALWALARSRIPRARARAALEPLRATLRPHPALDALFARAPRPQRAKGARSKTEDVAVDDAPRRSKRARANATSARGTARASRSR